MGKSNRQRLRGNGSETGKYHRPSPPQPGLAVYKMPRPRIPAHRYAPELKHRKAAPSQHRRPTIPRHQRIRPRHRNLATLRPPRAAAPHPPVRLRRPVPGIETRRSPVVTTRPPVFSDANFATFFYRERNDERYTGRARWRHTPEAAGATPGPMTKPPLCRTNMSNGQRSIFPLMIIPKQCEAELGRKLPALNYILCPPQRNPEDLHILKKATRQMYQLPTPGHYKQWDNSYRYSRRLDHIHPMRIRGHDKLENLQPLCKNCNCRKGNMPETVFKKVKSTPHIDL